VTPSAARPSFMVLVSPHLARLYAIARPLVADQAEDAVQDCLLKAFRSYDQLADPACAGAWLSTILVNCRRDRARAQARHPDPIDVDDFGPLEQFSLFRRNGLVAAVVGMSAREVRGPSRRSSPAASAWTRRQRRVRTDGRPPGSREHVSRRGGEPVAGLVDRVDVGHQPCPLPGAKNWAA
jgi:DNA-directed RNA polymerase specialized sigma24 family protein